MSSTGGLKARYHGHLWTRLEIWLRVLFKFLVSLFIIQCGLDVEDPTPPSPPIWAQKSLPEVWPERGIDAHESGAILLEWEDSDDDVFAHIIYRATQTFSSENLDDYVKLVRVETGLLNPTVYIDNFIETRIRYYYRLRSEDSSGNQSELSEPRSYMILPQVQLYGMSPNGQTAKLPANRVLSWLDSYSLELENYIVSIVNQEYQLIYRRSIQPSNYLGEKYYFKIPEEINLVSGMIYNWRIDVGANHQAGRETTGSESPWGTFQF